MPIIVYAIQALETLPTLISGSIEAVKFIEDAVKALKTMQAENRDPTPEEWDSLNALIEQLQAQLQ